MTTTRREFLRLSSTAAAGLAIVAVSQNNLLGAPAGDVAPLLSVGYAPSLPTTTPVGLMNASSLLTSDASFLSHDARISIHGGARAEKYLKNPGGVAVDAIYPVGYQAEQFPRTYFWSASRFSTSRSGSAVVTALSTSGISLSIKGLASRSESILTLGLTSKSDPKLQRGVYVIALRESASDSVPNWNRLELVRENGRIVIPGATTGYAILHIDYAR